MSTPQKKKRASTENRFKALQQIESSHSESLVALKCSTSRSTTFTWLLPANKDKIMAAFSYGTINLRRKNVKAGIHEDLDKAVMSARSNNVTVSGLVL